ncbi:uncharacterized protein DEA37_0010613 [Paragonimus westermani]|uniref:Alpha-carbonic anhydrase domain-containing protein n=1 Tax=Paragonimus westermani TaxID=34504 RepID=A0A5J4NVP7_9TREM|nr:uncharacterized protein DEA37_0010613 [Paragonimus westermani]
MFLCLTPCFTKSLLQHYTGPETWGTKSTYQNHQKNILWPFCQQGRQQSPIDIQTERLVYDHSLKSMVISGRDEQLELIVENVGQDLQLSVLSNDVVVSGGPLSYRFQVFSMRIKFGSVSSRGSDHRIDGRSLPGELSNTSNKDLLGVVAASEKTIFKGEYTTLKTLRRLRIAQTLWSGSMADNFRPVQSLNNRSIRTNINFSSSNKVSQSVYSTIYS